MSRGGFNCGCRCAVANSTPYSLDVACHHNEDEVMRAKQLLVIALSFVVICVLLIVVLNPLRRSEAGIRRWVLSNTPLGSSREVVKQETTERGWVIWEERTDVGVYNDKTGRGIGSGRIIADVGSYRSGLFMTYVQVRWAFDDDDRLIDVVIVKSTDSI